MQDMHYHDVKMCRVALENITGKIESLKQGSVLRVGLEGIRRSLTRKLNKKVIKLTGVEFSWYYGPETM